MAIQNSKQTWTVGAMVRVGFLTLRVLGVQAIRDGRPDIYTLASLDGNRRYEFTPHYRLERIS
jgi:hypothetical protein